MKACGNEDINDILSADEVFLQDMMTLHLLGISIEFSQAFNTPEKTNIWTGNEITMETEDDPQYSSDILETSMHTAKIKHMVDIKMKKYKAVKRQLVDIYSNFIHITNMNTFKTELQKPLKKRFPGFVKQMKDTLEALKKDPSEFEFVVTGETSAGKSTFLNSLLGMKILPSHILHTTSCLCKLHNSPDKKVSYWDTDENKTLKLTSDNPKEIEDELRKIIGPKTTEDANTESLRTVDIYWPIPLLEEGIILDDTPGIGETTSLIKQVVECVPNADGYIFIINSFNAGGVQADRVLSLLQEIKRKQDPKMTDFSTFLFVCNKWDLFEKETTEEVDKVWTDTWKKLERVCGTLQEWQVIKFSSKLELELLNKKTNHTDAYVEMLTGLENILMKAMYKRIGCKLEWIHKFMTEMNNLIDTQITGARSDPSTLHNKALNAKKILDKDFDILETETEDVLKQVRKKTTDLAEELRKYLELKVTFVRLVNNLYHKMTDFVFRTNRREYLSLQLNMLILEWSQEGTLRTESVKIDEKLVKLEEQMEKTFQTIEWFGFQTTFVKNDGDFLSRIKSLPSPGPIQASLGIMTCFIIGAALAPFTLGLTLLIPIVLSSAYLLHRLRSQYINRMARAAVEHAKSQSVVNIYVSQCFEIPYTEKIKKLKTEFKCRIRFIRKTIEKMEKDVGNKRNLSEVLHTFRTKIKDSLRQLQKVIILYGDQNIVFCEQLIIGRILSKTDVFHLYTVKGDFEGKRVTLRVLAPNISVFYMKEIENIRAMDHENFASHVAMVFTTSTLKELPEPKETCDYNDDWLRVLIEPFSEDLETYVFSHKDEIGCFVGESAKAKFVQISSGIINGLAYIHSKNFVHGQLQLSAVLLCGHSMLPKLCDLNVLPYYKERNHEKCIYHTAPEVLIDGAYKPEADVYSFGILLWELWYGRHTRRNGDLNELIVCSQQRPKFWDQRPPQGIERLISMCWAHNQTSRPTAEEVRERLLKPNELV